MIPLLWLCPLRKFDYLQFLRLHRDQMITVTMKGGNLNTLSQHVIYVVIILSSPNENLPGRQVESQVIVQS